MSAFTEKQLQELQSGYVVESNMDPLSDEEWFRQRWIRQQIVTTSKGGYRMLVSTIELHPLLCRGNLKYETLVFPTEEIGCEINSDHYVTIEDAREGHRQLAEWARGLEGDPSLDKFWDEPYFNSEEEELIAKANAAMKVFTPYLNVDINED